MNNDSGSGSDNLALATEGAAVIDAPQDVAVPNLTNTKRFDCGNGRAVRVRVAGEVARAKLEAAAGGMHGAREALYCVWCARWGITSLEGDWGKAPDGKPWRPVATEVGLVQPEDLVTSISPRIIGDIALYVNVGAYLSEVQGKA